MTNNSLSALIKERILVLDGAMGTMIQSYNLQEADFRGERFASAPGLLKGCNDLLCLTRPDIVADIHRRYLNAGADIIETNSFNAQRISMEDYGMQSTDFIYDFAHFIRKYAYHLHPSIYTTYTTILQ